MVDNWTKSQTIATFIGLSAVLLASFAILVDRYRRVHEKDENLKATDRTKMRYFYADPLGRWDTLMGQLTPALQVTSISGLIEAGDRGFWTSAALDRMPEGHSEVNWVPLFASIFEEVWHSKIETPIHWGDWYHTLMNRIRQAKEEGRVIHKVARWRHYDAGRLMNCCRPLDRGPAQKGKEPPDEEMSAGRSHSGLGHVRPTWTISRKPCIETTREELIALALIIGTSIKIHGYTDSLNGVGAFGLSLYAIPNHGSWSLGLTQGARIQRHMCTMGSGYTTLMAKHLACGSVPFAQNSGWVKSIYLNKKVTDAILHGQNIKDISAYGGQSLELLRMLPAEKGVDAYYGVADDTDLEQYGNKSPGIGMVLRPSNKEPSGWEEVGEWPRAVAGIAFGGLVPQAYPNVAKAVRFTTWGIGEGANGRLIEQLERLTDVLHEIEHKRVPEVTRHDSELPDAIHGIDCERCIFGPYVRSRYNARRLVDYVNYVVPWEHTNPRAAASVFARYSNLLERIVTLCDFSPASISASGPLNGKISSHSATSSREGVNSLRARNQKSKPHDDSESAPLAPGSSKSNEISLAEMNQPSSPVDMLFEETCKLLRATYAANLEAAKAKQSSNRDKGKGKAPESCFPCTTDYVNTPDLGASLSNIIATKITEDIWGDTRLPLSPSEGAFIVRCILAAWAWQVPHVDLVGEEETSGDLISDEGNPVGRRKGRIAHIDELPPVLVFG